MKNLRQLTYLFSVILLMLAACTEDEEEIPGQPPTVNAGADLTGTVGNTVALNGTASDPDGDQLTTSWSIVSAPEGSSATINNASSLNASFVPDVAGPYTIQLSVSDGNYDSVTDEVLVTVEESVGEPPVPLIVDKNGMEISVDNENNTVSIGTNYLLDAGNSFDPDGDELTFTWEVVSAPENADYSFTESADKKQTTFAPKTIGDYVIKVTVTDTNENAASKEVTLSAVAESVLITENVDADTTWIDLFADPSMPDYVVKNNISVNASLTIEPGVVIHLDEDVKVTVPSGGTMIAEGTQDKTITFTSSDEAGKIYWGGLLFESSSANNSLNYVNVRYGGGDDIVYASGWRQASLAIDQDSKLNISNSAITNSEGDGLFAVGSGSITLFENNTFANNAGYAMSASINQAGAIAPSNTFEDNPETNNRENLVRIYDSSLEEDQEWHALGGNASYVFVGNSTVNASLTIHEGARLEFEETVTLTIESGGVLAAKGTTDNKIVFTSAKIAEGQNWGGMVIKSSSINNELDHVQILHSGGDEDLIYDGGWRAASLGIDQKAKLKLTNTEIAHGNATGLFVHREGILEAFGNNNFHDNAGYALFIPANQVGMVDAATTITENTEDVVAILQSTFNIDANFSDDNNPGWVALNGEARYLITDKLTIDDDLVVAPGAHFMINEDVVMEITTTGSLKAVGTPDSLIVFTATSEDGNNNWGGMVIKSDNGNEIRYAKVNYAGNGDLFYASGWRQAIIGIDNNSTLQLFNTEVTNSKSYGLVVHSGGSVNGQTSADTDPAGTVITGGENTFSNNTSGDILFVE